MNTTKAIAALDNAVKEVENLYEAAIVAGKKDPLQLNGLQALGKANLAIEKAKARLTAAVERTTPKPKEEKKAKADKK